MCGIAGFLVPDRRYSPEEAVNIVASMSDRLSHRGPDGSDTKVLMGVSYLAAFGHRRLSVVDLSSAGAQPMESADGRYTIVYNGEVYAFEGLRKMLLDKGCVFRGHSDTEVILEHIAHFGVEKTLPLLEGMFAFALWDKREETLTLARDRVGIKPLYWADYSGVLGFSSELKALFPVWRGSRPLLSRHGQILYAHYGYVPAPHTIYEHVYKLEPGHFLTQKATGEQPSIKAYDTNRDLSPVPANENLSDYVHNVLSESVRITLNADVPVGCFLSGGIDSSLVTALMQSHTSEPVRTFAIGFEHPNFDESYYARAVADHLGTNHTELIVGEDDLLSVIPILADMYDEPFADSSQIPTYLVSKLAREQVTVSLSGDGGDELFLGYDRYRRALRVGTALSILPSPLRTILSKQAENIRSLVTNPSKISSYLRVLESPDFAALYNNFVSYDTPLSKTASREFLSMIEHHQYSLSMDASCLEKANLMRQVDVNRYMVDDVLTKVDRASMRASLESRVPLLNSRVLDMAYKLPISALVDDQRGKIILRDVLARYLPKNLFERPKMGFGVPMASWIRGPLKDRIIENIEIALCDNSVFDALRVRKALAAHLKGNCDFSYIIWLVSTYGDWKAQQNR